MVPLGTLMRFNEIAGPDRVPRYNLFPTVEVKGTRRRASARARRSMMSELAARVLPEGITYEWTDLSYQEKQGRPHGLLHLRAVGAVRVSRARRAVRELVAAARHHADRADVPARRRCSACGLHGQDINILTQIGFIVLIGLAAKNAILIVEFARQLRGSGPGPGDGGGRGLPACVCGRS